MPGSPKLSLSLRIPHQSPVYDSPSHIRATCPSHLIFHDYITRKILSEEYRSLSSSLCNFFHSSVTSTLLGTNILLSNLFWNIFSIRSPKIQCQAPSFTPIQNKCKIRVQCTLIFKFLDSKLEDKRFLIELLQAFAQFNLFLICYWIEIWFVKFLPKYTSWQTTLHMSFNRMIPRYLK